MAKRFLPSQEWSSGGRGIGGELANCGTRHCEIPAFAGMVYLCTGELWVDSALFVARHCEIPAYAGMVFGGNGVLLANLATVRATIWRIGGGMANYERRCTLIFLILFIGAYNFLE